MQTAVLSLHSGMAERGWESSLASFVRALIPFTRALPLWLHAGQWFDLVPTEKIPVSGSQRQFRYFRAASHWMTGGWPGPSLLIYHPLVVLRGVALGWGWNQDRQWKHSLCSFKLLWTFLLSKPVIRLTSAGRWGMGLQLWGEWTIKSQITWQSHSSKESEELRPVVQWTSQQSQWWLQENIWALMVAERASKHIVPPIRLEPMLWGSNYCPIVKMRKLRLRRADDIALL